MALPANYSHRGTALALVPETDHRFVKLPLTLLYDLDVKPLDKVLYLVICDQSWRAGECGLPQPELAALVGRKQRQLQESLTTLIDSGLIGFHRFGPTQAKHYWPVEPGHRETHAENRVCLLADTPRHTRKTAPVETETHAENRVDTRGKPRPHTRKTARVLLPVLDRNKDRREDGGPELATSPAPEMSPVVVPEAAVAAPPPPVQPTPPSRSRPKAEPKPKLPAPSSWPVTSSVLRYAKSLGYADPGLVDGERDRMLDYHRTEGKGSADWDASLRTWLRNEIGYAARDGRPIGVHDAPSRPGAGRHGATRGGYSNGRRDRDDRVGHAGAGTSRESDVIALQNRNDLMDLDITTTGWTAP